MQLSSRVRLVLARRPWIYWLVVVVVAVGAAAGVERRLAAVDEARRRWSAAGTVAVAAVEHRPGDPLVTRLVEVPEAAIPDTALDQVPTGTRATQRIAAGEIVVELDVAPAEGPAWAAGPNTLVVPLPDPLAGAIGIGQRLQIVAEGIVLAERASVVDVVGEVLFVAVDPNDAPEVAAATRRDVASILLVP